MGCETVKRSIYDFIVGIIYTSCFFYCAGEKAGRFIFLCKPLRNIMLSGILQSIIILQLFGAVHAPFKRLHTETKIEIKARAILVLMDG
jgi:hypothetical protein